MSSYRNLTTIALIGGVALALTFGTGARANDGTICKAPGNCWEPKPGYPDQVAGSKYDPKHDPKEIAKQAESIRGMDERNSKRVEYFKRTGQFIYDVSKIPN